MTFPEIPPKLKTVVADWLSRPALSHAITAPAPCLLAFPAGQLSTSDGCVPTHPTPAPSLTSLPPWHHPSNSSNKRTAYAQRLRTCRPPTPAVTPPLPCSSLAIGQTGQTGRQEQECKRNENTYGEAFRSRPTDRLTDRLTDCSFSETVHFIRFAPPLSPRPPSGPCPSPASLGAPIA